MVTASHIGYRPIAKCSWLLIANLKSCPTGFTHSCLSIVMYVLVAWYYGGALIAKQHSSSVLVRIARVDSYVEIEACRWNGADPKIWPQYTSCNKLKHIPCWLLNTWKHFTSYQYFIFNNTSHHNMHPSHYLCLFLLTNWLPSAQHMDTMTVCVGITPLHHCYTSTRPDRYHYNEDNMHMGWWDSWRLVISLFACWFRLFQCIHSAINFCVRAVACVYWLHNENGEKPRESTHGFVCLNMTDAWLPRMPSPNQYIDIINVCQCFIFHLGKAFTPHFCFHCVRSHINSTNIPSGGWRGIVCALALSFPPIQPIGTMSAWVCVEREGVSPCDFCWHCTHWFGLRTMKRNVLKCACKWTAPLCSERGSERLTQNTNRMIEEMKRHRDSGAAPPDGPSADSL